MKHCGHLWCECCAHKPHNFLNASSASRFYIVRIQRHKQSTCMWQPWMAWQNLQCQLEMSLTCNNFAHFTTYTGQESRKVPALVDLIPIKCNKIRSMWLIHYQTEATAMPQRILILSVSLLLKTLWTGQLYGGDMQRWSQVYRIFKLK